METANTNNLLRRDGQADIGFLCSDTALRHLFAADAAQIVQIEPFMWCGLFYLNSLDQSIFNRKDVWLFFFFFFIFLFIYFFTFLFIYFIYFFFVIIEIPVFNAK